MSWFLQAKSTEGEQLFPLSKERLCVIGRHRTCDIQLKLPSISRRHLRLSYKAGSWLVEDLGSSNGTKVNDQPVESSALTTADKIQLEGVELRLIQRRSQHRASRPTDSGDRPVVLGKRYELGELFHRGATGDFHRARDIHDDRQVCVKVLAPYVSSEEDELRRFVRGFRTANKITHPNIVQLYQAGRSRSGDWWIAMEYVNGCSVRELALELGVGNMLTPARVLKIARDLVAALQAAYERQIVHRNVKPDNVLLTRNDTAKLSNFSLSRGVVLTTMQQITRSNEVVGDIAYAAPESLERDGLIDCRSDIYSLGACLYTLLCGQPPFTGRGMVDLLRKVRSDQPSPPSTYNLSVGGPLEGVVMRCLAKSPTDRYQTPIQLLAELERVATYRSS